MDAEREELKRMIIEKALLVSDEPIFKVASGKLSRYYFDCKPVTLNSRGIFLIGNIIFKRIRGLGANGIGGLTFGADPISIAVAYTAEIRERYLKAFSIRKEQKKHGTDKWIEGDMRVGERVVIVDDVITTGASIVQAIKKARKEDLEVIKVIALIDRQEECGIENIKKYVKDVEVIFKKDELIRPKIATV